MVYQVTFISGQSQIIRMDEVDYARLLEAISAFDQWDCADRANMGLCTLSPRRVFATSGVGGVALNLQLIAGIGVYTPKSLAMALNTAFSSDVT